MHSWASPNMKQGNSKLQRCTLLKICEKLGMCLVCASVPTSMESNVSICLLTPKYSLAVIAPRSVSTVHFCKTLGSKMSNSMHELVRYEQGLQCMHQTIHVAE